MFKNQLTLVFLCIDIQVVRLDSHIFISKKFQNFYFHVFNYFTGLIKGDGSKQVLNTALHLAVSMKRDWIQVCLFILFTFSKTLSNTTIIFIFCTSTYFYIFCIILYRQGENLVGYVQQLYTCLLCYMAIIFQEQMLYV